MTDNPQPVVVLVEPQLPENIGMCARAMLNCGWSRLRLVAPREGWPHERARAAAADADLVLDRAEVFDTLDEAIADCRAIYATTARDSSLPRPVLPVEKAAVEIANLEEAQSGVAILFGPEASGLDREALSRAGTFVRFETNPAFPSLNLSQAVLLFAWEWKGAAIKVERAPRPGGEPARAERAKLDAFLARLEEALEERGFFVSEDMRDHTVRMIRSLLAELSPVERDLQLMQGMLTALTRPGKGKPAESGE